MKRTAVMRVPCGNSDRRKVSWKQVRSLDIDWAACVYPTRLEGPRAMNGGGKPQYNRQAPCLHTEKELLRDERDVDLDALVKGLRRLRRLIAFRRVYPAAIRLDERDQLLHAPLLRDIRFDLLAPAIERDLAARLAYIAVIGIGHLAGAVDDAAHHGDADVAAKMGGGRLDLGVDRRQVELGAPAGGTGDELDFGAAQAQRLQNIVTGRKLLDGVFGEGDADGVADALRQQRADAGRAFDARVLAVARLGDAQMQRIVHAQ